MFHVRISREFVFRVAESKSENNCYTCYLMSEYDHKFHFEFVPLMYLCDATQRKVKQFSTEHNVDIFGSYARE